LWLRPAAIKPSVQLGEPDETSAADPQGRKVAFSQYSLNCSTAEPETLSQMICPDQDAFNIRLHLKLPFTSDLPFPFDFLKEQ
jgi:hypothetical protein